MKDNGEYLEWRKKILFSVKSYIGIKLANWVTVKCNGCLISLWLLPTKENVQILNFLFFGIFFCTFFAHFLEDGRTFRDQVTFIMFYCEK